MIPPTDLYHVDTLRMGMVTSRLYSCEHDLRAMLDFLILARSQAADWRYAHVGELLFSFFMVAIHLDPCANIRVWQDESDNLVGYAILGEDPSFDFQVLEEYAWLGIEEQAFAWVLDLLADFRQQNPANWGGDLVSGARQDDLNRIAFLDSHGFCYRGRFTEVNMLRSLSLPIPGMAIPAGIRVCSMADLDDIGDRAAAHRDVWQPWTVGNLTETDYVYFMHLPGYYPDLDVVALAPDGSIAAYVNGWVDLTNRIGDFGPVGARPAYRRQGFTRLVLLEALRRMRLYGMERVCISTGISNTPAFNLYSSLGFQADNRYLDYVRPNLP